MWLVDARWSRRETLQRDTFKLYLTPALHHRRSPYTLHLTHLSDGPPFGPYAYTVRSRAIDRAPTAHGETCELVFRFSVGWLTTTMIPDSRGLAKGGTEGGTEV